jgi:small basic protein (TIGR04137 family)
MGYHPPLYFWGYSGIGWVIPAQSAASRRRIRGSSIPRIEKTPAFRTGFVRLESFNVSIDKSLKRKSRLARVRSVLTRPERIDQMKANEKWVEGTSPFGIPKTRVIRLVLGKKKKKKAAEGTDAAADKKKAAKKK